MRCIHSMAVLCLVLLGCSDGTPPVPATTQPVAQMPGMPMAIDVERSANQRWLNKPVVASKLLDSMEDPAPWSCSGPGQMSFTAERARDGKQSIRLVSRTAAEKPNRVTGRPWGEAILRRAVGGEDWSNLNRISVWVYPTMPGFKNGSVVLRIFNDGREKIPRMWTHGPMHYALVKPGQWNHIVWEITHLTRDKVTAMEFAYRLQGNEPGAADTVSFDWDQLEIQQVEPDYFEGWPVAPGHIAFSHVGYELTGPKTALANGLAADTFRLISKMTGRTALTKPIRALETRLGKFQLLDFSEVERPGEYFLSAGDVTTPAFSIQRDIWLDTVWKTLNFFYCERCGDRIDGIHDICHQDWQAEHDGRRMVINGGWHDAGDLSQGVINTGEATHAMFTLAERMKPREPLLYARLVEEAKWGLAWLHKTRFGDGFRVNWATMDYWTDNKIGTADDTFGGVGDGPADNAVGAAASAVAARVLKASDPALAAKSLQIARADWQSAIAKLNNPNIETLSGATLATVELYKTTDEQVYAEKAVELARQITSCQQKEYPDWHIPLTGFFYASPRRDRIQNYFHRGHDQAPVVALVELCNAMPQHPDWVQWYATVTLYSDYLEQAAQFQEPYGILPAGVYRLADNPPQVGNGLKLSDTHYLRRFPAWGDMRGHFGILLSQTKALAAAAQLRNRQELSHLCQLQLQWVVGRNPFAQSTMYGVGYDDAPQYSAMSGDMAGSLPVGIQTKYDLDTPYWPATNCWNYKEVWVHPSSRWLFIMADLLTPRMELGPLAFTLTQKPAEQRRITIAARVRGTGQHRFTLRAFNLAVDQPVQSITLERALPQVITWSASVQSPDTAWVAVVYPDDDLSRLKDVSSPARHRD